MPLIGRRNAWLALQRLFGRDREPAKSVDFISRYFWPYLTIVSGSLGRLAIQAGYFLVLANTLSISNFGIFAAVSGAGIMIGSFTCFGFSAAAFRAAATRGSTLFGARLNET